MTNVESAKRPVMIGPRESRKEFGDYLEAATWLVGEPSEAHEVSRLFLPKVIGSLSIFGKDSKDERFQQLTLRTNGLSGTVPVYYRGAVYGGVTVANLDGLELDILANVEGFPNRLTDGATRDRSVLDRGAAWVTVGETAQPLFHATVKSMHEVREAEELAAKLSGAEERAVRLVEGILRSEVIEEIARGAAG